MIDLHALRKLNRPGSKEIIIFERDFALVVTYVSYFRDITKQEITAKTCNCSNCLSSLTAEQVSVLAAKHLLIMTHNKVLWE